MKHSSLILLLGMIFFSACAGVDRGGEGRFGQFERVWGKKGHVYRVKNDPREKAAFKKLEYFELQPSESDILLETNRDSYSGNEYWYGWSIYFPGDFPNTHPALTELGAFIQYFGVTWLFANYRDGYYLIDNISPYNKHQLIDKKDLRCRWHKIEVQARWSRNRTGFFRVWVNGVKKVDYQGETLRDQEPGQNVAFTYGIMRYRVSRYKSYFNKEIPTQRVYFANVKRGDSRRELRAHAGL